MARGLRFAAGCWAWAWLAGIAWGALPDANDTVDTLPASQAIPVLTQRLLDALPTDSTVWKRYLSDRAVYVSEAGEVASKAELLEGFGPFPPGLSGSIEARNFRITELGDVAVSVFDAHERQTVYDQQIEVDYRSTYTWRREDGHLRLIAAQAMVVAKDPRPLPIDTRVLRDYAGVYELAGKRRYQVVRRGDSLLGGATSGTLAPLIPVGENVFADTGSPLGILRIFVRGRDRAVHRMVVRRKFADVEWTRVPATSAKPSPAR